MTKAEPKLISREEIDFLPGENTFRNQIFKEKRELPNGKIRTDLKFNKPDVVMIAGFTTNGDIIAEEEFQPGVGASYLKLPGGNVDEGEYPVTAAKRELEEETGYRAGSIELVSTIAHDSGRSDSKVFCYLATNCKKVGKSEEGITIALYHPKEFWNKFLEYLVSNPTAMHGGANSLKCSAVALRTLQYI